MDRIGLMLCLLPLGTLAEMDESGNVVVKLEGVQFFFTPVEGECLTRESSASAFGRLGLSQREMLAMMEERGLYAVMFDPARTCQIEIGVSRAEVADFDDMTEYGEMSECAYYEAYLNEYGYQVAAVDIYAVLGGQKFVWTDASYVNEDGEEQHFIEYFTCKGGFCIWITLFPFAGEVTEEQLALGDGIADSMWIMEDAITLDISGL